MYDYDWGFYVMAKHGKTINVYLIDGEANGKAKASITNFNGVAYRIPRALLDECKDFEAFNQSGVYFLFDSLHVYVGQAEKRKSGKGIHQRIVDHESDKYKDFWDEVVIFTTKDNSLGRTDISYLENRFYNLALQAGRYSVQNSIEPTIGTVTEEKESELEEFIDYAELILAALGYKVFEPPVKYGDSATVSEEEIAENEDSKIVAGQVIPKLDETIPSTCTFVKTTMKKLAESGYVFDEEVLNFMQTPDFIKQGFRNKKALHLPFLITTDKSRCDKSGKHQRYWKDVFSFNGIEFYAMSQWDNSDGSRERFIEWYKSLGEMK